MSLLNTARDRGRIKVWDPFVRTGHWLLVFGFVVAWLTEDDFETLHAWAGYLVGAIVAWRIVWGVAGTRHARFADFVTGPAPVARYARSLLALRPIHYLGHNPLGGWMVVALLCMLALTTWTGLEAYATQGKGPLAGAPGLLAVALADGHAAAGDGLWKEIHEACAEFTLFLVVVHVAGVLVSSVLHRENLVAAMITGYKIAQRTRERDERSADTT